MEIQKQNYTDEEQKEIAAHTEQIDEGEYVAKLVDVDDEKLVGGAFGPAFLFIFEILEEPYEGKKISGPVTMKWRPDNKLDKWLLALGLDTSSIGTKLNPKSLLGRQVRIWVEINKKGYAGVKKLNQLRKSGTPATPATPATPVATVAKPAPVASAPAVAPAPAPVAPAPAPVTTAPAPAPQTVQGNVNNGKDEEVPF